MKTLSRVARWRVLVIVLCGMLCLSSTLQAQASANAESCISGLKLVFWKFVTRVILSPPALLETSCAPAS